MPFNVNSAMLNLQAKTAARRQNTVCYIHKWKGGRRATQSSFRNINKDLPTFFINERIGPLYARAFQYSLASRLCNERVTKPNFSTWRSTAVSGQTDLQLFATASASAATLCAAGLSVPSVSSSAAALVSSATWQPNETISACKNVMGKVDRKQI
jgi:hypothetical protein